MDWLTYRRRYAFLADVLEGIGGFKPVTTLEQENGRAVYRLAGPTHLVRYPRESDEKFGARNRLATYENHLRSACDRFVGFLARRRPHRSEADAPLVKLFLEDADLCGNHLDRFLISTATQLRARGVMLVVIDKPEGQAPQDLATQTRRRAVPYVRTAAPEDVVFWRMDSLDARFAEITLAAFEWWGDKLIEVERTYTVTGWEVRKAGGGQVLAAGTHPFGECPVLPVTETGAPFPVLGKYEQIADLSTRLFNARSELDEILRGQTFSLLTLQVPPDHAAGFDAAKVGATIGTHSMLVHSGDMPGFIAPDAGPAQTYLAVIEQLRDAIARIAMEDINAPAKFASSESGAARRMRFDAMNAELVAFSMQLQGLERRIWALFHRALGTEDRVKVQWPTDYNLADSTAELDILALMQSTGFPPEALAAKQRAIAAIEFDNEDDVVKAAVDAAIDQGAQRAAAGAPDPSDEDGHEEG
ncbi:MAG: hypothetical protein HYZ20_19615 [Burkholderiales bacterium]|nr:hypothetical protein [Burkholderiales bacterium]